MNWAAIIFVLAAVLTADGAVKKCKNNSECDQEKECCVFLSMPQLVERGRCKPLARSAARCSESNAAVNLLGEEKFMRYCPCEKNLQCVSRKPNMDKEKYPMKYLLSLRCNKETTATTTVEITTSNKDKTPTTPADTPTTPGDTPTTPKDTPTTPGDTPTTPGDTPTTPGDTPTTPGEVEATEPAETEAGPGGEPPRDDDCEDWTYGC